MSTQTNQSNTSGAGLGRQPQVKGAEDRFDEIANKPVNVQVEDELPEFRTGATSPPRDEQDIFERTGNNKGERAAKGAPVNEPVETSHEPEQDIFVKVKSNTGHGPSESIREEERVERDRADQDPVNGTPRDNREP